MAVVSHESALDILDLSDVVPDAVHLTVPRSKRYRRRTPGIAVHTTTRPLGPSDVVVRDGIRVTSAERSIADAVEGGTAPDQVSTAVTQALERGLTTESRLLAVARERGRRVERLVRRALQQRSGA
jgi:predicted transcriptional regulator of viral defense system